MTLGERVSAWRKAKKLTQEQLADASGLATSSISQCENDKHALSHAALQRVVAALKISMVQFYGRAPGKRPRAA